MPRGKPLIRLTLALAALGLFLIGYYWGNRYRHGDSAPPAIEGVLLHPAYPLPTFELRDGAGRPFTTERFAGHWTLLAFGDSRQTPGRWIIARLIEIHNRLAADPDLQAKLRLVLVTPSGDPAAPTSDLGDWSPVLSLLSGETDETRRLQAALGMPTRETTPTKDQMLPGYLIDPSGRLLALFPEALTPAAIASDLIALAAHTDSEPRP